MIFVIFPEALYTRLLACALRQKHSAQTCSPEPQQPPAIQPSKFHYKLTLTDKIKFTFFFILANLLAMHIAIFVIFPEAFYTRLLACALRNILHKPARLRPQQPPAIQPSKFHCKLNLKNKIKFTFFLDFDKFAKRIVIFVIFAKAIYTSLFACAVRSISTQTCSPAPTATACHPSSQQISW